MRHDFDDDHEDPEDRAARLEWQRELYQDLMADRMFEQAELDRLRAEAAARDGLTAQVQPAGLADPKVVFGDDDFPF